MRALYAQKNRGVNYPATADALHLTTAHILVHCRHMTISQHVGHEIFKRRRALGHSQDALAGYLCVNRSTISRIEAGIYEIGVTRLLEIADWLDVKPVRLLPGG